MYEPENKRDFEQMMEIARDVSPQARVRKLDSVDQWEIYIPTEYWSSNDLPERFAGTPAAAAYEQYSSSYDNQLFEWGEARGLYHSTVDEIAERYNLSRKWIDRVHQRQAELNAEQGVTDDHTDRENAIKWLANQRLAQDEFQDEYAAEVTEMDERWS